MSVPEAVVLGSVLRGYRIRHELQNAAHAVQAWHVMLAIGGIRVWVAKSDAETALALLEEVHPVKGGDLRQSTAFREKRVRNAILAFAILIYCGLPFPFWVRNSATHRPNRESIHPTLPN